MGSENLIPQTNTTGMAWEARGRTVNPINKEHRLKIQRRMAGLTPDGDEFPPVAVTSAGPQEDLVDAPANTNFLHEPQIDGRKHPAEAHAAAQERRAIQAQRFGHLVVQPSQPA